jgi:hypothetical protein
MLSGLCWSIWKLRNSIIFKQSKISSNRNMIILICSLIDYWTEMVAGVDGDDTAPGVGTSVEA